MKIENLAHGLEIINDSLTKGQGRRVAGWLNYRYGEESRLNRRVIQQAASNRKNSDNVSVVRRLGLRDVKPDDSL